MRNTIIIIIISLFAVSCGKDKFTSAPQIKFKSVSPNVVSRGVTNAGNDIIPVITLNVTDLEGDLGYASPTDISYVFVRNLLINRLDSFRMPDIQTVITKNFQADILINTFDILRGSSPAPPRGKADTLIYEIYVQDFAKNKSNVVTTAPLYYVTP
ncbi:hypothetical protein BH11BAC3_BH11BAC3_46920 [soil metagenome]